jgi:hypothetical protein
MLSAAYLGWIMPNSPTYSFIGGDRGSWEVISMSQVAGEMLEPTPYFEVRNEYLMKLPVDFRWLLRGVASSQGQVFGTGATCAAFIPVKKKREWWEMTYEERLRISGEQFSDTEIGSGDFPGIARHLHHSRELGEPFDFLTWFEYAPSNSAAFEELVLRMRSTEEWKYVEREVDVRLVMRK